MPVAGARAGSWVPTAYLAEGIPFAMVIWVAGTLFKDLGRSDARDHRRHGQHRPRLVPQAALGAAPRHGADQEVLGHRDGDLHGDPARRGRPGGAHGRRFPRRARHPVARGLRIGHAGHLRRRHVHHGARRQGAGGVDRRAGDVLERRPHLRDRRGRVDRGRPEEPRVRRADRVVRRPPRERRDDGRARRLSRVRLAAGHALRAPDERRRGGGPVRRRGADVLREEGHRGDARVRLPLPHRGGVPARRGAPLHAVVGQGGRARALARAEVDGRRHAEHAREHRGRAARRRLRLALRAAAYAARLRGLPERAAPLLRRAEPGGDARSGAARRRRSTPLVCVEKLGYSFGFVGEHALHDAAGRAGQVHDDPLRVRHGAHEPRARAHADGERTPGRSARVQDVLSLRRSAASIPSIVAAARAPFPISGEALTEG